ncbi:MAG: magnesium transporter, partial [Myxococcales bacterium]|nr:magnesium transporter [Myxococcales bacterium]
MSAQTEPTVLVETVRRLLRRNATRNLLRILDGLRPADIALIYRGIAPNHWKQLFGLVRPKEKAADVLTEMDDDILEVLLDNFTDDELVDLLRDMSSDDAADMLDLLPEERAESILADTEEVIELSSAGELLQYDPETAGGRMIPDAFSLPAAVTVGDAIAELQRRSDELEMVFYLYIVNDHGH